MATQPERVIINTRNGALEVPEHSVTRSAVGEVKAVMIGRSIIPVPPPAQSERFGAHPGFYEGEEGWDERETVTALSTPQALAEIDFRKPGTITINDRDDHGNITSIVIPSEPGVVLQ